jgi:hypothetical protein
MRSFITCTYQNVIRVIESRNMSMAGHVARIEGMENPNRNLAGNPKVRDHSEDLGVDRRIILEWILEK